MDARERILKRFQDCLKTIGVGIVFVLPHAARGTTQTNLAGRVFSRMVPDAELEGAQTPRVEFITSAGDADEISYGDDNLYFATTRVRLWGYCDSADAGVSPDATVRPILNQLRADLIIAMHAAPFWTGPEPDQTDSLVKILGARLSVNLLRQWTSVETQSPRGEVLLEFEIGYPFSVSDP